MVTADVLDEVVSNCVIFTAWHMVVCCVAQEAVTSHHEYIDKECNFHIWDHLPEFDQLCSRDAPELGESKYQI